MLTYTPIATFAGHDQLTYQVCAPSGPPACARAQVLVEVSPNVNPVLTRTVTNSSVSIDVTANDFGDAGSPVVTQPPAHGTVTGGGVARVRAILGTGNVNLSAIEPLVYTPARGFAGADSFLYARCAESTSLCSETVVVVAVHPLATKPPVTLPPTTQPPTSPPAAMASGGSTSPPGVASSGSGSLSLRPARAGSTSCRSPPCSRSRSVRCSSGPQPVASTGPDSVGGPVLGPHRARLVVGLALRSGSVLTLVVAGRLVTILKIPAARGQQPAHVQSSHRTTRRLTGLERLGEDHVAILVECIRQHVGQVAFGELAVDRGRRRRSLPSGVSISAASFPQDACMRSEVRGKGHVAIRSETQVGEGRR